MMDDNSFMDPLASASAQLLSKILKENEEIEESAKVKYNELSALMNNNSEIYDEISKLFTKVPKGHPIAEEAIEKNTKYLDKLRQEVYREPSVLTNKHRMSLVDIENQTYGRDEFTMKPFEDVEAEIKRLQEANQILKQNINETAAHIKSVNEETQNYCKEIESDSDAIKKAEVNFEEKNKEVLPEKSTNWDFAGLLKEVSNL